MADTLVKDLCEKRASTFEEVKKIVDEAEKREENPGVLTAEEEERYNKINTDLDALDVRIERHETLAKRDAWLEKPEDRHTDPGQPGDEGHPGDSQQTREWTGHPDLRMWADANPERRTVEYEDGFRSYLTTGIQTRALQADSDTVGGYLVPPVQWINKLITAKDNLVHMRRLATVFPVTNGDSLGAPSLDNDPADPAWTAEIGTVSEDSTMSLGKRELHPHQLSKLVKISMKLLRKAAMGADSLALQRLAYKFAVTEENAFINGSGSHDPLGVMVASADGISTGRDVSTDNTTTAITADGLIEAFHALKGQYWGTAEWGFHRDAMKMIRKLKDGNGQYLWQPGLQSNVANRILDRPYWVSEYMPNTFTTGLYVGIIGDFSHYWIADSLGFTIQRLQELYAANNQVGIIGRAETDGMPVLEEAFVRVTLG